jgi:uncharacterized protein (DUF433 family)
MRKEISSLLVASPDCCGGRLRIEGTRVTVNQIVVWYLQGYTAEEIADQYPHLSLASIYAALAYYHANIQEIENELVQERAEAERLEQEYQQTIKQA